MGALSALFGGVFGLAEKLPVGLNGTGARRLAAFALACIVALIIGILMRTHQVLSPSTERLRAQLADIGIENTVEQNRMLLFLRFGLLPPGVQAVGKDGEATARIILSNQSFLYAKGADFCASLRTMIRNGAGQEDLLSHLSTGSSSIQKTVLAIKALPVVEQASALQAAPLYLCAP